MAENKRKGPDHFTEFVAFLVVLILVLGVAFGVYWFDLHFCSTMQRFLRTC